VVLVVRFTKTPYLHCIIRSVMLVKELGEAIKKRRKELGIIQPHLAELAQISVNTLYKLEKGQGNPSFEVVNKLADVLGMALKFDVKK